MEYETLPESGPTGCHVRVGAGGGRVLEYETLPGSSTGFEWRRTPERCRVQDRGCRDGRHSAVGPTVSGVRPRFVSTLSGVSGLGGLGLFRSGDGTPCGGGSRSFPVTLASPQWRTKPLFLDLKASSLLSFPGPCSRSSPPPRARGGRCPRRCGYDSQTCVPTGSVE